MESFVSHTNQMIINLLILSKLIECILSVTFQHLFKDISELLILKNCYKFNFHALFCVNFKLRQWEVVKII